MITTLTANRRTHGALMIALALVACGDRVTSDRRAEDGTAADRLATDSIVIDPIVAAPSLLASACLAGDHVDGTHRTLEGANALPLEMRSIASFASRDSARFAARISRTVDVLPSDTSVADFRGLPVSVRAAWSLVPSEGDTVVVAFVGRRVPIESAPLEESFSIIAAPGQRQGVRDPLIEHWVVRDVGREEELPGRELAGAFVQDGITILVFAHDAESGPQATLVARRDGRWRSEWSGPVASCAAAPPAH
jgi:hypothetical protein